MEGRRGKDDADDASHPRQGAWVSVVECFKSKSRNPGQISTDLSVSRSNSACHAFIIWIKNGIIQIIVPLFHFKIIVDQTASTNDRDRKEYRRRLTTGTTPSSYSRTYSSHSS